MSAPGTSAAGKSSRTAPSTLSAVSNKVTSGSSHLYDIPSLDNDGTNFHMWKFWVQTVLGVRHLWSVVSGEDPKPDETTQPDEHKEWLAKDKEAHAQLTLTLKDEPLSGVLYSMTSAEVWKKLSEQYEERGKQSIAYLISELFRSMLSDDTSMETQLNSMQQKANILKTIGQPLDDSLVAIAMVISLPMSYSTLRTILMAADDKLTTDMVINQVLIEERSKKLPGQTALSVKVMSQTKGKGKAKSGKKGQKKKGTCTYCSKDGHMEDVCYKKKCDMAAKDGADKSKEKPKEEKTELVARLAQVDGDSPPPLCLFMARNPTDKTTTHDWIIDSGASAHMSCQHKWFTMYRQLVPPQSVTVGNGTSIPTIGIGCVSINLKLDGDHTAVTVIRDVYFMPNLDGNLLSVSCLANFNLEVVFSRDSCLILDGSQLVGKGYKRNSLYMLAAKPCLENQTAYVINGPSSSLDPELPLTALATQKTTSEADIDIWHRRLGHVNVQSILKLLRKGMVDGMAISDSKDTHGDKCIPCLEGKQHCAVIPSESNVESPQVLHRTYSNVCGPMEMTAWRGHRYFVTFIDGYSHHLIVKLIKEWLLTLLHNHPPWESRLPPPSISAMQHPRARSSSLRLASITTPSLRDPSKLNSSHLPFQSWCTSISPPTL